MLGQQGHQQCPRTAVAFDSTSGVAAATSWVRGIDADFTSNIRASVPCFVGGGANAVSVEAMTGVGIAPQDRLATSGLRAVKGRGRRANARLRSIPALANADRDDPGRSRACRPAGRAHRGSPRSIGQEGDRARGGAAVVSIEFPVPRRQVRSRSINDQVSASDTPSSVRACSFTAASF